MTSQMKPLRANRQPARRKKLTRRILRSWVNVEADPEIAVTSKDQVTSRLYGGACPIEALAPFYKHELPPKRFPHSMTDSEIDTLLSFVGTTPGSLLEIGCFWGDTSIAFAKKLNIPVVCADTWLGGLETWINSSPSAFADRRPIARIMRRLNLGKRWRRKEIPPASAFFRQFASNVYASGAVDKITSIRLPSPTAMRLLKIKGLRFDAIYVDASHDYMDVFVDIALARKLTTPTGFVFGDDFQSSNVRDAVVDYCNENNLTFDTLPTEEGKGRSYWVIRH